MTQSEYHELLSQNEGSSWSTPPLVINLHKGMKKKDYDWADRTTRHMQWQPPAKKDNESDKEYFKRCVKKLKRKIKEAAPYGEVSGDGVATLWPKLLEEVIRISHGKKRPYEHFNQFVSCALRKGEWKYDGKGNASGKIRLYNCKEKKYFTEKEIKNTLDSLRRQAEAIGNGDAMSFTYGPFSTTRIDPSAVFSYLASLGIQRTRAWCWEQWTGGEKPGTRLSPYRKKKQGKDTQWILGEWDKSWWKGLRSGLETAQEHGLHVDLVLFDWSGLKNTKNDRPWDRHEWNPKNNSGDHPLPSEKSGYHPFFELGNKGCTKEWLAIQRQFVVKVLKTTRGLKNVALELCNEPRRPEAEAQGVADWHREVKGWIHSHKG